MCLESVQEEHLRESAFLWGGWERALQDARLTLTEVAVLEERLLAHLDGLVLGGAPVAEALLCPALEGEDPEEVFAAAFTLLEQSRAEVVLERVATASGLVLGAVRRALELSPATTTAPLLLARPKVARAEGLTLALDVLDFRQAVSSEHVLEGLAHPDEKVAAAALRAARHGPMGLSPRDVARWLEDARPEVRWEAVKWGALIGSRGAWSICRGEAKKGGRFVRDACVLLALGGDGADLGQLLTLTEDEATRADALWALGFSGRKAAAEACLELCRQEPSVARLAAEAFAAITGVVLEGPYVISPEETESLPPLEEEDLGASLTPTAEDALPVPEPEALAHWWSSTRKDFTPDDRSLGGIPFSSEALLSALASGPMRRRFVHSWELALRTRGVRWVQARAFTMRQRDELALARTMSDRLLKGPLARLARE